MTLVPDCYISILIRILTVRFAFVCQQNDDFRHALYQTSACTCFLYYNFCLCKSLKEHAPMERITALPIPRGRSGLVCGCKGTAFPETGKTFAPFIWKNSQDTIIHIIYNIRARGIEVLSGTILRNECAFLHPVVICQNDFKSSSRRVRHRRD